MGRTRIASRDPEPAATNCRPTLAPTSEAAQNRTSLYDNL